MKCNILQVLKLAPVHKHLLKFILVEHTEWTRTYSLHNILPSHRILYLYQQRDINTNIIPVDLQGSFQPGYSEALHFSTKIAFLGRTGC